MCKVLPDKNAILFNETKYSYSQLNKEVVTLCENLETIGCRRGSHLGTLFKNGPEFIVLMLAAARSDLILVPLNPSYPQKTINRLLEEMDVDFIFSFKNIQSKKRVEYGKLEICRSTILFFQVGLTEKKQYGHLSNGTPFILTATSGSTGNPKPIALSQEVKILRSEAACKLYGVTENDIILSATPLHHSLGMRLCLLPLLIGATSVILPKFSPQRLVDIIDKYLVSFSILVSSQLLSLSKFLQNSSSLLTSLRLVVSSSAPLDKETKLKLRTKFSFALHECYGTSELSIVSNINLSLPSMSVDSVGEVCEEVEVRIIDNSNETLPEGRLGEICCRSKLGFTGYYGLSEETDKSHTHDGFFRTGDIGMIKDNTLFFRGRIKDVIITGGMNIYPQDIEEVILDCPNVKECAALGIHNPRLGEILVTIIAPNEINEKFDILLLQRHCLKSLSDYQQPIQYYLIDTLPLNSIGKIDKPSLRSWCMEQKGLLPNRI